MKKIFIAVFLCSSCLMPLFAGFSFGLVKAVKKTMKVLDEKVANTAEYKRTHPRSTWSAMFGGAGNEFLYSISQTADGGYIAVGETDSYGIGDSDLWLLKITPGGLKEWDKTFGTSGYDAPLMAKQATDGGYIIVGVFDGGDLLGDIVITKTDPVGTAVWESSAALTQGPDAEVQQTLDGGYIIAVSSSNGGVLVKTDPFGSEIWSRNYGCGAGKSANAVQQTDDGGYIVTGSSTSSGVPLSVWLAKFDSGGNMVWENSFGGLIGDVGDSVRQTSDGGYIICGVTMSYGAGGEDIWLIKTSSAGVKVWDKTFGGALPDEGFVVIPSDGGYVIAGRTRSFASNPDVSDAWLIKTDAGGNQIWTRTFSGPSGGSASARAVQQTVDGGYIIGANTNQDFWLIKTNANGEVN